MEAAHIFPRAHAAEVSNHFFYSIDLKYDFHQWSSRGFLSLITDRGPYNDGRSMGGQLKIDSLQNLLTLRSDVHKLWDRHEIGVDPDVSSALAYSIIAFMIAIFPE
jgi:hypothetical protein